MKIHRHVYFYKNRKAQPFVFEARVSGKRISRAFKNRHDAVNFAKRFDLQVFKEGATSVIFSAGDKALLRAIREVCGEFDPLEAVRFWKAHSGGNFAKAPPLEKCCEQFLSWLEKSGRSARHIRLLRGTCGNLCSFFADRELSQIHSDDLLAWVSTMDVSARTKRNYISNAMNFFSWCKTAKKWLVEIPRVDERLLPVSSKSPVYIWSFTEFEKALRWIEKHEPRFLPHYVLRAFAGLRTSEATQMKWEWIDFENKRIRVPASICKTRDDWVLLPEFLPCAVFHWLRPHRKKNGTIVSPPHWVAEKISRACNWKPNVLRHTFATMLVALFQDEGKVILATRHTNVATLRQHYRGVNQPHKDAVKFFALRPKK